jgi:hypothetical protein
MATELSFKEAFERLVTILNEKNLGWIVAQVEEQIRVGIPVPRRVKELRLTRRSAELQVLFRRDDEMEPGRAVEFRTTIDYTDAEQLRLLLSAIHYAIVSTASMGRVVTRRFPGLVFLSEQDDHRFAVSELEQEERLRAVDQLQHAIVELIAELP